MCVDGPAWHTSADDTAALKGIIMLRSNRAFIAQASPLFLTLLSRDERKVAQLKEESG